MAKDHEAAFEGFSPKAMSFFRQLEKNNNREWFKPRKELFDVEVYEPMRRLVSAVGDSMRKFAADYVCEPKKAIFRFYRDTRFSKDKSPYKTHIAAAFTRHGAGKTSGAAYYFAISHRSVDLGGGIYLPDPAELLAVRQAIADDPAAFERVTKDRGLTQVFGNLQGQALTRVPKGFDANHPAGQWLRMKQFYFHQELPASLAQDPSLQRRISAAFLKLTPFVLWIEHALRNAEPQDATDDAARPRRPAPMF